MSAPRGFKFRLQPLLDHRLGLQEEAEQALALCEREVAERLQGLQLLAARRQDMRVYLGALQQQPALDIQAIDAVSVYDVALKGEERELRARLREAEARARDARDIVVQRRIDVEVIEKLRERDLKRFNDEQRAREERLLDELASAAYARNMGAERGLRPMGETPWTAQESISPMSRSN
jgi:flagellar FliJ protein